jgi:hypothetical protein
MSDKIGSSPRSGSPKRDPSLYGLVVIGTPVWNSNISTPIRTYITRYKDKFQDVALFCTGSAEDNKVLWDMEALIGKKTLASLKLRRKQEIEAGEYSQKGGSSSSSSRASTGKGIQMS